MSVNFLNRFKNRIQKLGKEGRILINCDLSISTDIKSSHVHCDTGLGVSGCYVLTKGPLAPSGKSSPNRIKPRFLTPVRQNKLLLNAGDLERLRTSRATKEYTSNSSIAKNFNAISSKENKSKKIQIKARNLSPFDLRNNQAF